MDFQTDPQELVKLVEKVLESAKYAQIDANMISRIGLEELEKGRKFKDAVKATKNKLHQVAAVYQGDKLPYTEWLVALEARKDDIEATKARCKEIMAHHASTRERLPILETFYTTLFAQLPPIESVLDMACGFNPLTSLWMDLPPTATYYACDVYYDMLFFVGKFLEMQPFTGRVEVCDLVGIKGPTNPVDLALVLKTLPCLEQMDKQAGARLLDHIQAKYLVVSFPAKSLGGREKGMVENYESRFMEIVKGKDWEIEKFEFETELAFLVKKDTV